MFYKGGCKHALAFIMWVHRRSEEPAPTEVTSYWKKPVLSTVGTSLKYVSAMNFCKKTSLKSSGETSNVSDFQKETVRCALAVNAEGHILKYTSEAWDDEFAPLSIYKILFKNCRDSTRSIFYEDFLFLVSASMDNLLCNRVEKMTKEQSHMPLWFEMRYGRITASKLHEFANCHTSDGTLVEGIIGAYKIKDNKHMQRGRMLEADVIKCLEKERNCVVNKCGFFIYRKCPIFGASPDGLSGDYVVEVKCPSKQRNLRNYIFDNEVTPKFKAQVHLQMLCAGKKKGLFCVASEDFERTKNVQILEVEYDENFIKNLIDKAKVNYKNFVYPKLLQAVQ